MHRFLISYSKFGRKWNAIHVNPVWQKICTERRYWLYCYTKPKLLDQYFHSDSTQPPSTTKHPPMKKLPNSTKSNTGFFLPTHASSCQLLSTPVSSFQPLPTTAKPCQLLPTPTISSQLLRLQ